MDPDKVTHLTSATYNEIVRLYGEHSDAVKELQAAIREHVKRRMALAQQLFESANRILVEQLRPFQESGKFDIVSEMMNEGDMRSAVSRYYYAFYQVARAVCFEKRHADEESHGKLPELLGQISPFGPGKHHEHLRSLRERRNVCV